MNTRHMMIGPDRGASRMVEGIGALLALLTMVLFAAHAQAAELIETWDDPLEGWLNRWVAQNTNMQSACACFGYGEGDRCSNPCGLWPCDGVFDTNAINIVFDPNFGASISSFEMGIQSYAQGGSIFRLYDLNGQMIYSANVPQSQAGQVMGCETVLYGVQATPYGVGRFELAGPDAGEGKVAIDNMRVTTSEPTAVEPTTWGAIKSLYR